MVVAVVRDANALWVGPPPTGLIGSFHRPETGFLQIALESLQGLQVEVVVRHRAYPNLRASFGRRAAGMEPAPTAAVRAPRLEP